MKFRTKILVCMVWILALALGAAGMLLIGSSFRASLEQEKASALGSYRMAVKAMEVVVAADSDAILNDVCVHTMEQMYNAVGWTAYRLSLDDEYIARLGLTFVENGPPPQDACLVQVFSSGQGHYIQVSGGMTSGERKLVLTTVTDVTQVYRSRDRMFAIYCRVFAATVLIGGLISYLLSALLTRPLGRVSRAARKMAQGDLTARVQVRSGDEVGTLARDFNHMAQRLEENVHAMEESMAAQERFMGSFAHELKTPMTSIIGYADLLRSQSLTESEAQEAASYIFSEGKRLESLSLKLLELLVAKQEKPALEHVAVDRLVQSLVGQMAPVYRQQNIRLQCKTEPGAWDMDPVLMRSVLMNLMDNARKAMDSGGRILVCLDYPEGNCRIRVIDDGRGMPSEAVAHVTEAFYRVDKSRSRAQGGAGLGLSLCNEIVRIHGGELGFASQPGKGTCVSVILKGGAT